MEDAGLIVILFRRWRLVAIATVAVAAIAVVVGSFSPVAYEVTTRFMINDTVPELAGTPFTAATGSLGWQGMFAPLRSDAMISSALGDVGVEVEDVGEFIKGAMNIVPDANTRIVTMSAVVPGSKEQAVEFAETLLVRLDEYNVNEFNRALEARVTVVREALDASWERVRVYPLPDTYDQPVSGGWMTYDTLSYELAQAEVALAADKELLVVMSPPRATNDSPSPVRTGAVGVALGLIAGIGVALIMDARDSLKRAS